MMFWKLVVEALFVSICFQLSKTEDKQNKSITIVMTFQNQEHNLPFFLALFEKIEYPKEMLHLFIRTLKCEDESNMIFLKWLLKWDEKYANVNFLANNQEIHDMTEQEMKEDGLNEARDMETDFILFLDVDVFLIEPNVLHELIDENQMIVAPMLTSIFIESNFWLKGLKIDQDYKDIVMYKKRGCFLAESVSKCVLIKLSDPNSKHLSFLRHTIPMFNFNKGIPIMNNIVGITPFICNRNVYGNFIQPFPSERKLLEPLQIEKFGLSHITKPVTSKGKEDDNSGQDLNHIRETYSSPSTYNHGFDKIFCINLLRRPDRKESMQKTFSEFGLDVTFQVATDWKDLNETYLESLKLKTYKYPYKSFLTLGLTANVLSHYSIWKEIVRNNYSQVIIFEDDASLDPSFNSVMENLREEISQLRLDWDIIYLGREVVSKLFESKAYGSKILVKPRRSFWAGAYMMSNHGARRLIKAKPLENMAFIELILFALTDISLKKKHSKGYYPPDLIAFAVQPPIAHSKNDRSSRNFDTDTMKSSFLSEFSSFEEKDPPPTRSARQMKDRNCFNDYYGYYGYNNYYNYW